MSVSQNQHVFILAGGESRRMGEDKALLKVGNHRLVDIAIEKISEQGRRVFLSGAKDYGLEIEVVRDHADGPSGPVGAIFSIMKFLESSPESPAGFFTVPVDAPGFPDDLCDRLHNAKPTIAATPLRSHPTFAWWTLEALQEAFADMDVSRSQSLTHLAEITQAKPVIWRDESLFCNINTPNDLRRYLTR